MKHKHLSVSPDLLESFCIQHFGKADSLHTQLRAQTQKMPEGHMQISVLQAKLLTFLVETLQAHAILEIGTYTGLSTLTMAQSLPETGHIITCDRNKEWTKIASKFWELGNLSHKITLMLGEAAETLVTLKDKRFDLIFIDADKKNYQTYLTTALSLLTPKGIIVFDNVLWYGLVADPNYTDPNVEHMRCFIDHLDQQKNLEITLLGADKDAFVCVRKKLEK